MGKPLTRDIEQQIHDLTDAGLTHRAIAKKLRISRGAVYECLGRRKRYLQGSRKTPWATSYASPLSLACYEPTQEEIAAACEEIQKRWTEAQRMARCVYDDIPVTAPDIIKYPSGRRVMRHEIRKR